MNNNEWTCCVQVPHRTDRAQALDASVQDVFFDDWFKVWNEAGKVNKKCRVDPPPSKKVLRNASKWIA